MKGLVVIGMLAAGLLQSPAHAQEKIGNGGDSLEPRFLEIANDIRKWIRDGGARALRMREGDTIEEYQTRMLLVLDRYSVSFTQDKIYVNGAEKDCENDPLSGRIRCATARFPTIETENGEDRQYRLVHHELAGLAGLEQNLGSPKSDYFYSDQISASLETVMVKRLVVKSVDSTHLQEQFKNAKPLSLEQFLNSKHPVFDSEDMARWKCTHESGRSSWINAIRNGRVAYSFNTAIQESYRYSDRAGTVVNSSGNEVYRRLDDHRLIVEESFKLTRREVRNNPHRQRSLTYPELFANYLICVPAWF
jgi:hypothetical protein